MIYLFTKVLTLLKRLKDFNFQTVLPILYTKILFYKQE